jgi:hypothetical protein
MLNDLIIVGYYTSNTAYEQEAERLVNSCKKLGLENDVIAVNNLGTWQLNTRYKASFMLEMLAKHAGKRLLYVDSDAVFHRQPELFINYRADIAVRYQDFAWRKNECLSGTIYMENSEKTRQLCRLWLEKNRSEVANSKNLEQWNLGSAIDEMVKTHGLICKNLPAEYTFIFDSMRKIYPDASPVIEHFQASRRLKRMIK